MGRTTMSISYEKLDALVKTVFDARLVKCRIPAVVCPWIMQRAITGRCDSGAVAAKVKED
jgi:hypothetical protein